jgi:sarcosine oxidase subunit beta
MRDTAEVVIIGAGIVGASIAYHLTEAGCKDVLVLERETRLGLGSTGKSMGGVRAQFATDVNIRMSLYSIPFFAQFEEATGFESGYKPHGYLFVATSDKHMAYLTANYQRQLALGLRGAEVLQPADVIKMFPQMRSDDILGGTFCPTDGFVDPYSVMNGFLGKAQQNGCTLERGVEVTGIEVKSGRVDGVKTNLGSVSCRTVVNAAGPWAGLVAKTAGVDLPIYPMRRMLVPTEPFPGLPDRLPMVIDMSTGFHFRPEGIGLLMAWNDPDEKPGFQTSFDLAFVEKILTHAVDRVPSFADLQVNPSRGWAGMYSMSPDHHSILGPVPDLEGFYCANGFSGHGVMHSPATGRIVSDLILRGGVVSNWIDAELLSLRRFAEGRTIHESALL